MYTKVLVNHNETYYWNVKHSAFVAKWLIRFGLHLALVDGTLTEKGKLRIPRRNVVALVELEGHP